MTEVDVMKEFGFCQIAKIIYDLFPSLMWKNNDKNS